MPHCRNPFPPHWPSYTLLAVYPPTSTQHGGSICNLKNYIEKEHLSALISHAKNTIPSIDKWISNTKIHIKWSNLLWDAPCVTDAQIAQTLTFRYGRYLRNYWKKNPSSNNTHPCHVNYTHPTKMTHAFTYYHVALINT